VYSEYVDDAMSDSLDDQITHAKVCSSHHYEQVVRRINHAKRHVFQNFIYEDCQEHN